jgi:hypothetical protein
MGSTITRKHNLGMPGLRNGASQPGMSICRRDETQTRRQEMAEPIGPSVGSADVPAATRPRRRLRHQKRLFCGNADVLPWCRVVHRKLRVRRARGSPAGLDAWRFRRGRYVSRLSVCLGRWRSAGGWRWWAGGWLRKCGTMSRRSPGGPYRGREFRARRRLTRRRGRGSRPR